MRPFRALGLTTVGFCAGFMAAGAVLKRALPSRGDAESDEVALTAIFDGVELESHAKAFRGGSMLAWWGGISVDFRQATIAPQAHLDVASLWGGIALRLPAGVKVESRVASIAGGVAVDAPEPGDPEAPTLVLEGFTLFGGVAVKASQLDDVPD